MIFLPQISQIAVYTAKWCCMIKNMCQTSDHNPLIYDVMMTSLTVFTQPGGAYLDNLLSISRNISSHSEEKEQLFITIKRLEEDEMTYLLK